MKLGYINWDIDPELINVFGVSIRYYGMCFAGGIIMCSFLLNWVFKKENLPSKNLDKLSLYCIIGIVAGARLGHCLFYDFGYYSSHPIEMLLPISFDQNGNLLFSGYQGLASHGGVLGVLIALFFYSKKTKHSFIDALDLITVVIGVTLGFIRLGNFMNSEIIGIPTDKPWAVIFHQVDQIPRHPAQLYESFSYFLIFLLLFSLYITWRPKLKNGFFFGLSSVLFFTARISLEFLKENQVEFEDQLALNMGQILSVPFLFVGLFFIVFGLWKTKKDALVSPT